MYIVSGIFENEDGAHLLHFIDNALVQKKAKQSHYDVNHLFDRYVNSLRLNNAHKISISTLDVIDHINVAYKNRRKEDRYIVYMDSIREFFFNVAHNVDMPKTNHKVQPAHTKSMSVSLPLSHSRLRRKSNERKSNDAHTVISESTNINSTFSKYSDA